VLSRVFREKFVAGLRRAFRNYQLVFYGECLSLENEKNFTTFLRALYQHDWVVYAKPGGPEHVHHYLEHAPPKRHQRGWTRCDRQSPACRIAKRT